MLVFKEINIAEILSLKKYRSFAVQDYGLKILGIAKEHTQI